MLVSTSYHPAGCPRSTSHPTSYKLTNQLQHTSLLLVHWPSAQLPGLQAPSTRSLFPFKKMACSLYSTRMIFLTSFPSFAFCHRNSLSLLQIASPNWFPSFLSLFSWNTDNRFLLLKHIFVKLLLCLKIIQCFPMAYLLE